jgi:hypothetical protein
MARAASERVATGRLPRVADALALAALLVVAIVPVREQLLAPAAQTIGVEARIRVGWEAQTRRAMSTGSLPFWNPYHFGGRPHLADPETQALYPPHLLFRFLPLDLFFPAVFVLHAWAAGVGGYLIWRQLAAGPVAALAGSVAVMLVTVLAPAPDMAYVPAVPQLAWVPLVVALAMQSVRGFNRTPSSALVGALVVGLLCGSLRGAVYVSAAALTCYLASAVWPGTSAARRQVVLAQLAWLACLAVGLTAIQFAPAARLRASTARAGGLSYDDVSKESWHSTTVKNIQVDRALVGGLSSPRSGRAVSACDAAIDDSQFLQAGIAGAGGGGGALLADYARFANLAGGLYPEKPAQYQGLAGAGAPPTRFDLLKLMNVGVLVSCAAPSSDRWTLSRALPSGAIYRQADPLPRAFWTCAPEAVGRDEMVYRLTHHRYDENLNLIERRFVHVRWAASVTETERARLESDLHIVRDRFLGERTWRYELEDGSRGNLGAIVTSPAVEDTAGIDRGTFDLLPDPAPNFAGDRKSEWLVGTRGCDAPRPAAVLSADRSDGVLVLRVDAPREGIVFISDTYYPDRRARVDGRLVATFKTNLAFTAVPVTQGTHRVELQYDQRAFQAGAAVSALTLIAWTSVTWRSRSRR